MMQRMIVCLALMVWLFVARGYGQYTLEQKESGVSITFPCEPQRETHPADTGSYPVEVPLFTCFREPGGIFVFSCVEVPKDDEPVGEIREALYAVQESHIKNVSGQVKEEKLACKAWPGELVFSYIDGTTGLYTRVAIVMYRNLLIQVLHGSKTDDKAAWDTFYGSLKTDR